MGSECESVCLQDACLTNMCLWCNVKLKDT